MGNFILADETGRTARLISIERILTDEPVYDLTVEDDHSLSMSISVRYLHHFSIDETENES